MDNEAYFNFIVHPSACNAIPLYRQRKEEDNNFFMDNISTIPVNGIPVYMRTAGQSDKAIVFIHGSSQQSAIWEQQLTDHILKQQFRLIALDLPGHGHSGHSAEPEQHYSIEGLASLVAECLNELSLQQYLLAGHSLGTNIISEALPYLAVPPQGLFFASASIANKETPPAAILRQSPYMHVRVTASPSEEELTAYTQQLTHKATDKLIAGCKQYYHDTDPAFRTVLGKCLEKGMYNNEIAGVQQSKLPLCLVMGQLDEVSKPDYLDNIPFRQKWKDTIYKVPAAGHLVNCDQPQIFNHLLTQFATALLNSKK